ncbi:SCO family protein [Candidatus Aeolococcus gillhamiae]|uniref:SCO family protein n=1 Tax=Candidatus Aeolococcus gillhamiae TaxID=3127015 RepID=UPI0030779194
MTTEGRDSFAQVMGRRFSTPLLAVSGLALVVGLVGTVAVSRVLTHTAVAAAPAAAQYLPPVSRQPEVAPDFTLPDQAGTAVSLSSLRGKEVLITFMDPQCTAQCPIMGQQLGSVEANLPANVRPVLLVVSVAAGRSAADVAHFTSHVSWQPGWHWLLGDQAQLRAVWATYHIAVQPTSGDVLHDQSLYVVNPQGLISVAYNAPLPIAAVASAITAHSSR